MTVTPTALQTNEVSAIYSSILFRTVPTTDPNVVVAANALANGLLSVSDIAASIENSPEVVNFIQPMLRLYQGFFGRAPSATEMQFYVNALDPYVSNANATVAQAQAAIAQITTYFSASPEFASYYGTGTHFSEQVYITELYHNVLGRVPSSAEMQFYQNYLSSNGDSLAAQAQTATFFAQSPEFISNSTANINNWLTTAANTAVTASTATTVGTATYTTGSGAATGISNAVTKFVLTTGQDNGAAFTATSGNATFYGTVGVTNSTGATLQGFDSLTGTVAATNTLNITDASGGTGGDMMMPAGLTLTNIQDIVVTTAFNVGANGSNFDVSGFGSVTSLNVTTDSANGDYIKAATTTNVTITASATNDAVTVSGGDAVTAHASGSISVSGAAGAVAVTETGTSTGTHAQSVTVTTGSSVNVTTSGLGGVTVGKADGSALPSGAVTVTDTAKAGLVAVYGGTDVTVTTASADGVTIGGSTTLDASGAITVSDTATSGTVQIDGGSSVTATVAGGSLNIGTNVAEAGTVNATVSGVATEAVKIYGGTDTVTTTGGRVQIGDGATATNNAVGAVSINDTFSGPTADAIQVYGGTTVNITTTANSSAITVGIDAANSSFDPTGNVTIVNETDNSTASYGTSATDVYVNGSTSVSVSGGTDTIKDEGSTHHLATVSLTGITGAAAITSNALTALNLTSEAQSVTVTAAAGTRALTLTMNGVTGGTITDAHATTLNVTNTGTATKGETISATAATSVAVTANAALTIAALTAGHATSLTVGGTALTTLTTGTLTDLANITVTGSGGFTDSQAIPTTVTSIDASASTGAVTVTIDPTHTAFTGGSGANDVTISADVGGGPSPSVNGGGNAASELDIGFDNAAHQASTAAAPFSPASNLHISGFHVLGADTTIGASEYWDATGYSGLVVKHDVGAQTLTFENVNAGTTLTMTADMGAVNTHVVDYTLKSAGTSSDALNLTLATTPGADNTTSHMYVTTDAASGTGTETVNVTSTITPTSSTLDATTDTNNLTLTNGAHESIAKVTVTGAGNLTLTGPNTITTIDASSSSGAIDTTNVTLNTTTGTTIIGGSGLLKANGGVTANTVADVITVGAGGGHIGIGQGGLVGYSGGALTYGTGSETINLGNETTASQITAYDSGTGNGSYATINGFHVTSSTSTTDQLVLPSAGTAAAALANVTSSTAINNVHYTAANGIITFTGTDSLANLIADAAQLTATQGVHTTAAFQDNGNTYVVQALTGDTAGGSHAVDVEVLAGVTGVTGFADSGVTTAATGGNSILADVTGRTGTAVDTSIAATTTSEAGSSVVGVSTGVGVTNGLQTITNLANSAEINDTSTGSVATLNITQLGTGADLVWNSTTGANHSIAALTLNNTTTADFTQTAGATLTLTSLVDGGSTATLANVLFGGAGNVTLTAITDSALATIDASASTGTVTLTSVSNGGITIDAATTGTTVITAADGAADHFSQASGGGGVTITEATGAADVVSLSDGTNNITLSGAGDHITVGVGANTIVAEGANDVITLANSSTGGANNAATNNITVGANANVTLGYGDAGNSIINVYTSGTANVGTGTTANMTVVTNLHEAATGTEIVYAGSGTVNVTAAVVNVATATSLSSALNIAAKALGAGTATHLDVDWFQYQGNTYVVEHTSTGTAETALGHSDFVVELTGLHNLANLTAGAGLIHL